MANYENDHLAVTNINKVYIAVMQKDSAKEVNYGDIHEVIGVKNFSISPEVSLDKAYGSGRVLQTAQTRSGGSFSIEFHSLPDQLREEMVGLERDEDGITFSNSKQESPYLGVIIEQEMGRGVSKYTGLTKVMLTPNADEASAREDSVEFSTLSFEGETMGRLFDDIQGFQKKTSDEDYDFTKFSSKVFLNSTALPEA